MAALRAPFSCWLSCLCWLFHCSTAPRSPPESTLAPKTVMVRWIVDAGRRTFVGRFCFDGSRLPSCSGCATPARFPVEDPLRVRDCLRGWLRMSGTVDKRLGDTFEAGL